MNQELQQKLTQLADSLGTTTQYLWEALMRQAPISSSIRILFIVLAIVGWTVFALNVRRLWLWANKKTEESEFSDANFVAGIATAIAVGGLSVFSIVTLSTLPLLIAGFINPEYWALHKLLEFL